MTIERVIFLVLPFIALVLFATILLFGGESLFGKTSEATLKITDILPNISVGGEIKGEKPTILESGADAALNQLKETIQLMLDSEAPECFANYGTLPELQEKGTTIYLNYAGGKTRMSVQGGAGGKQNVEIYDIEGMIPCVISGTSGTAEVSENFYSTYLKGESTGTGGTYQPVTDIVISRDDGGFTGFTENRINFGQGFVDFEDGGWLFTPNHKHICFFPTVDGDNDEIGLNDDYLVDGTNENSVPDRVNKGTLKKC